MDPACLSWELIVLTWIRKFPKFIPESIREKLMDLFRRFCLPLLRLVRAQAAIK